MRKEYVPLIVISISIIGFFLLVFCIRFFSEKQLDDVSPGISCDASLLEKADAFYVIPKYKNISLAENLSWCDFILSFNKDLRLHGLTHSYNEFAEYHALKDVNEAVNIFEVCFNQTPARFKPPQEALSYDNRELIKMSGLKLDNHLNSFFHKVYHCSDSGVFSNRFIDWF